MLTTNYAISDIYNLEHVVQQSGMVYTKSVIIDTLRDIFSQDIQFKYVADHFGFPKTANHLGLSPFAGLGDDTETTRIFIGSSYRYDIKFTPSIVVRNTGSRYNPISFNQDYLGVINRNELLTDGYGNQTILHVPAYSMRVGAWDMTMEVKIVAEDEVDREELADIVQVCLMSSRRQEIQNMGVFIKSMSTGGETEEPYSNDKLYSVSINLEIRTEFKVYVPISDVVERLSLCLTFNTLGGPSEDAYTINYPLSHADLLK